MLTCQIKTASGQHNTCSPLENSHAFAFPFAFLAGGFSGFSAFSLALASALSRFLGSGTFGITCLPASDRIKVKRAGLGGYSFGILIK